MEAGGGVIEVAFSPDDAKVLSAGSSAVLWAASGRRISELQGLNGRLAVAFSPDGSHIAAVDNGVAAGIFDGRSGGRLHTLKPFSGRPTPSHRL